MIDVTFHQDLNAIHELLRDMDALVTCFSATYGAKLRVCVVPKIVKIKECSKAWLASSIRSTSTAPGLPCISDSFQSFRWSC